MNSNKPASRRRKRTGLGTEAFFKTESPEEEETNPESAEEVVQEATQESAGEQAPAPALSSEPSADPGDAAADGGEGNQTPDQAPPEEQVTVAEAANGETKTGETKSGGDDKVGKMRTTVMLSPEVVEGIDAMRARARRKGKRLTTSQIVDNALRLLMREEKVAP